MDIQKVFDEEECKAESTVKTKLEEEAGRFWEPDASYSCQSVTVSPCNNIAKMKTQYW